MSGLPLHYLREWQRQGAFEATQVSGLPDNAMRVWSERGRVMCGPAHHVGLFPFIDMRRAAEGEASLLVVLPKGARDTEDAEALVRFAQLTVLADGADLAEAELVAGGWQGAHGSLAERFVFLLAHHYAALLRRLVRTDFRRDYEPWEEERRGSLRGRLIVSRMMQNDLRGRAHRMPCRWEEFTADNHDNRLLKAAMQGLLDTARALGSGWVEPIAGLFRDLVPAFMDVGDASPLELRPERTRLGRVSLAYRAALRQATLLLRGLGRFEGGHARGIGFDTHSIFERFVEQLVRRACATSGLAERFQHGLPSLLGPDHRMAPQIKPDILIAQGASTPDGALIVGDTKYRQLFEDLPLDADGLDSLNSVGRTLKTKSAELYQLYAYTRITGARAAFFAVPFWEPPPGPAALLLNDLSLGANTAEDIPLGILGVNLLASPQDALQEGARRLNGWIEEIRGHPGAVPGLARAS